jgi:hypothetical protein
VLRCLSRYENKPLHGHAASPYSPITRSRSATCPLKRASSFACAFSIPAAECSRHPQARLTWVLSILGLARSVWYAKPLAERKEPGRKPKGVSEELAARIKALAEAYPRWGYKRIGVMARREGLGIKAYGLLQRKRVREAALYQAARLCPKRPMSCGRPM